MLFYSGIQRFYEIEEFEHQQVLTINDFLEVAREEEEYRANNQLPVLATENRTCNYVCAQMHLFKFREDHFQQGERYLNTSPMTYKFQRIMARDYKTSPLMGMPFDLYRRFGFSIWDD